MAAGVVGGSTEGRASWPGSPGGRSVPAPRGGNAMHELSITQSVGEAVTERTGSAAGVSVRLRVGRLPGVGPDAMRFCFELVTAGTPLEGAVLDFDRPEGRGHCRTCGAEVALPDSVLLCHCGSADVEVIAGRELAVASVVLGGGAA